MEGRYAILREVLKDPSESIDLIFEMLSTLYNDSVASGSRERFAECIFELRSSRPDVFEDGSAHYLSWCIQDALVEGRQEVVNTLSRELAAEAGRDIDMFNRTVDILAYHGQLDVLVEAFRIAWPGVRSSDNILPWGISEFAANGMDYEVYSYLEHTNVPDEDDAGLRERIRLFGDDWNPEWLHNFLNDVPGKSNQSWQVDDFALRPGKKKRQEGRDSGALNLSRLLMEFMGYLEALTF